MRFSQLLFFAILVSTTPLMAQSVCLPAPRLLTTMPMGGQVGTEFEVTISGQNLEDVEELIFSNPKITAKRSSKGWKKGSKFTVSIADDCTPGLYEARLMTRLGISSSRIFSVGSLPEVTRQSKNNSLKTAVALELGTVCNATMSKQLVDYYSFAATQGERIVVDCAAAGIDSKLKPVVIVGDENGADLVVERRGGLIDFQVPKSGTYTIKIHDLTYSGGPYYFYRLALKRAKKGELVSRSPSTQKVCSFSWPPSGHFGKSPQRESEPNDKVAQKVDLPCHFSGQFFPAADVDVFEFTAKKGEVWWVEVASERLGHSTDPSIVIQHVNQADQSLTDVAELMDIPSPVKVSSNGYSYDGPPYNAGSTDVLGKFEVKQDGVHRLRLTDLFGGTRNDPRNRYELIIRKAAPDFAVVAWSLHMNLRNGDRNALSKPFALRGGATMPIEVVVIRRDGFNGPIELKMEDLPKGVTAHAITIPAGKSRGIVLISAEEDAPRGVTNANFYAAANINGQPVERQCKVASMKWPVPNAWSEIPSPRLMGDVPVSVCGNEKAPITIAPKSTLLTARVGEKLSIPLAHIRRSEFSGSVVSLSSFHEGLGRVPKFDVSLKDEQSTATLDLGKLKTKPGQYTIAFYGTVVAKYKYNALAVSVLEVQLATAKKKLAALTQESKKSAEIAKTKAKELKAAQLGVGFITKQLSAAKTKSKPKDIADIVVSTPLTIQVEAAK